MTIHLTYTSNCLVAEPLPFPSLRSLTSASFASSLHDEHRKQFFPWISQLHYSIMLLSKTLNYYWVWLHLLSTLQYRHSCLSVSSFLKILEVCKYKSVRIESTGDKFSILTLSHGCSLENYFSQRI